MKRLFFSASIMVAALSFSLNANAQKPKKVKMNTTVSTQNGSSSTVDKNKDTQYNGSASMGKKDGQCTSKNNGNGNCNKGKDGCCKDKRPGQAINTNQQKIAK